MRGSRGGSDLKSGSNKGIDAGHEGATASAASYTRLKINVSTTQAEGPSSYIMDTRN